MIARPIFVTRRRNAITGQREKLRELRAGSRSLATFGGVQYEPKRGKGTSRPVAVGADLDAVGVSRDHCNLYAERFTVTSELPPEF